MKSISRNSMLRLITAGRSAVLLALAISRVGTAQAQTVATIYGVYDNSGFSSLPGSVTSNPMASGRYSNGGNQYDTPSLFFVNPSAYSITLAQMILSVTTQANAGQQTLNQGVTQTMSLGTLNANSITEIDWNGAFTQRNLFSYDYDDEYQGWNGASFAGNSGSFAQNCTLNVPSQHPEWTQFCAPVGNFTVAFTGILSGAGAANGQAVAAFFGEYDVNGNYTGWQGLDDMGWSENAAVDVHAGSVSGVLANIQIGTLEDIDGSPITATPEPATWTLMGTGLLGLAGFRRRMRAR